MSIVAHLLRQLPEVSSAQRRLVSHLLDLWPCVRGRFNFLNLSRYSHYSERTLRRHFRQEFNGGAFNAQVVKKAVPAPHLLMLAYDHSFLPKSGRQTPGLSWFYNGCAGRIEKGLELALLAVVDLDANAAYALHAQQRTAAAQALDDSAAPCQDLDHLRACQSAWPAGVKHLAADGAFTRRSFVEGVCALGLEFVGKLRVDADMRPLFTGVQSGRGRPNSMGARWCGRLWNRATGTLKENWNRACGSTAPRSITPR